MYYSITGGVNHIQHNDHAFKTNCPKTGQTTDRGIKWKSIESFTTPSNKNEMLEAKKNEKDRHFDEEN